MNRLGITSVVGIDPMDPYYEGYLAAAELRTTYESPCIYFVGSIQHQVWMEGYQDRAKDIHGEKVFRRGWSEPLFRLS